MKKDKKVKYKAPKIAIMTPYLTESFTDIEPFTDTYGFRNAGVNVEIQKALFGYSPANLLQRGTLTTKLGKNIELYCPEWKNGMERGFQNEELKKMQPILVIAGSTKMGETETRRLKESGLVIARYSIFYGDKSGYTGFLPEESGYSLDIPKRVDSVKEMLSDERLLDGLMERNEEKIRQAVGFLNKKLPEPIIITSYLSQALEVGRKLKNAKHKKKK